MNLVAVYSNYPNQKKIANFIANLTKALVAFDWRSSAAKKLGDEERMRKLAFRGGSGYKELRRQILRHLFSNTIFGSTAKEIYQTLGLDKEDNENAE
jgi:hypothetical protein